MNADSRSACAVAWFVIGALMVISTIAQVHAEGFRNPPEGAAALGRGGGKIALTDDATSVSHNPAALTGIAEPQVEAALTVIRAKSEFDSPLGPTEETEDPWKFLPNLYAAWPFADQGVVAGIGITTPFGQSTEWDKDGFFRYSAPYFAELRVVNVNPTLRPEAERQALDRRRRGRLRCPTSTSSRSTRGPPRRAWRPRRTARPSSAPMARGWASTRANRGR